MRVLVLGLGAQDARVASWPVGVALADLAEEFGEELVGGLERRIEGRGVDQLLCE